MLTLAIETSGPVGSVALVESGGVLGEERLELGKQHGQVLIPVISRLLAECKRKPCDCGLVAVSVGPGSFTGLRVGVVCAKTLAYAAGCPLRAVSTLQAIACNSPPDVSIVDVIGDAQRGDLFVGRFIRNAAADWMPDGEIRVVSTESWAASLKLNDVISGPGLEKFGALAEGRCRILDPACRVPRAVSIALLGMQQSAAGKVAALWSVEPLYLRRSSAELQWEKLHPGR
jgi:tRNA threonylcarbamoyladenosine biosynthesis protein TsaB